MRREAASAAAAATSQRMGLQRNGIGPWVSAGLPRPSTSSCLSLPFPCYGQHRHHQIAREATHQPFHSIISLSLRMDRWFISASALHIWTQPQEAHLPVLGTSAPPTHFRYVPNFHLCLLEYRFESSRMCRRGHAGLAPTASSALSYTEQTGHNGVVLLRMCRRPVPRYDVMPLTAVRRYDTTNTTTHTLVLQTTRLSQHRSISAEQSGISNPGTLPGHGP